MDMQIWKDYSNYVQYPMHLKLVDQKIEMDRYETPESFEYDVNCIFSNCVSYNVPKRNDHIVNVAKYCAKVCELELISQIFDLLLRCFLTFKIIAYYFPRSFVRSTHQELKHLKLVVEV